MKFKKVNDKLWEAVGEFGRFYIEKSRGLYWGHYLAKRTTFSFNMIPRSTLTEAKRLCETNSYWEE